MDPTFAHPQWIVAGVLLILGGFWLFRWAARNDTRAEVAVASTEHRARSQVCEVV